MPCSCMPSPVIPTAKFLCSKFHVPMFQVACSVFRVPDFKIQVPSPKFHVPSSKFLVSRFQVPCAIRRRNQYVSDVFAPKLHHRFMIWCPTIPFWTPKWSQTSSASSAGRPSGLAEPGRPGLASQAAGPARRAGQAAWRAGGLLPGKGTREERRRWRSAQELMEPPHSYHRRWVILYMLHVSFIFTSYLLRISFVVS